MRSEADFIDAIRANPTDPSFRLVYADELEERGYADRAEYIRLQVEKNSRVDCHCFLCLLERHCVNCRKEKDLFNAIYYTVPRWWLSLIKMPR
jgi:uncharacterized protein (TIGR02996 family)